MLDGVQKVRLTPLLVCASHFAFFYILISVFTKNDLMPKNILVIYNPISGKTQSSVRKKIHNALARHGFSAMFVETSAEGDYSALAMNEYDLILVAGGDGTLNAVFSEIIVQKWRGKAGIIPTGSANLLAGALGVPKHIKHSVDFALTSYSSTKIDAFEINKKHYAFVALGIGYDAVVMALTRRELKRRFGFLAYWLGMIQGLVRFREANFSLNVDGKRINRHAKTLFIMNVGRFFNLELAPGLSPNDGRAELAIVRPVSLFDLLKLFFGLVSKRFFVEGRLEYMSCKRLKVSYKKNVPVQIDGEVVDLKSPLELVVISGALEVVGSHYSK